MWKTKASSERWYRGATGNGVDKDSQRLWRRAASCILEAHRIDWNTIEKACLVLNHYYCKIGISSSSSSSSRSTDGNYSLLDEGGCTSQVPQATVELAGYGNVVWPDSLSEDLTPG